MMSAERTAKILAAAAEDALRNPKKSIEISKQYLQEYFISSENLECLRHLLTTQTWYLCLRRLYESTEFIEIFGFLVEADVAPQSSYTYAIDLTSGKYCCVCPVFTCESDFGSYVKLTNLVNEAPLAGFERKWQNKFAARNMPMPSSAPCLTHGFDYVYFPKRKVKVIFSNTHNSETAHCMFFADYMQMELSHALNYMVNIYEVLTAHAERMIAQKQPEWIRNRYFRRMRIVEELEL